MKFIKQLSGIATVLISLTTFVSSAKATNLVSNGDFEYSSIGNISNGVVAANSNFIQDWKVGKESVDLVSNRTGITDFVYSGEQAIDMTGSPGAGSIFQDLATTTNTAYELSFYASSNGAEKIDGLSVFWDGALIDTITTPTSGVWEDFTYNLSATSNLTRLEFASNISGYQGSLIDNVKVKVAQPVQAVPEPGMLIGSSMVLFGGIAFKRKRAKSDMI